MTAPAILFLEMHKPLAFLGAQMLWAAQPFLNIGWNDNDLRDFAAIIEDRAGVEQIINRLESIQAEQASSTQLQR
ncbi:MAG: hypothetical protein KGJ80_03405 [Chloroflexota bacterium]|nr:hypothetical protein [Chloroflexota bacterium]